jgi:hypothetical protein
MTKNLKLSKQLTLDNLPNVAKESKVPALNTPEKRIVITEISTATKEDELALKIALADSFKNRFFQSTTGFILQQSTNQLKNDQNNSRFTCKGRF